MLPRRWHSGLKRSLRKRKVGCSNPTHDRPKSYCQTLGIKCECHGSLEMTIIDGCPVSQ